MKPSEMIELIDFLEEKLKIQHELILDIKKQLDIIIKRIDKE